MPEAIGKRLGFFFLYHTCINAWLAADRAADWSTPAPWIIPARCRFISAGLQALFAGKSGLLNCPDRSLRAKSPALGSMLKARMSQGKELTWRGVALGMSLTFLFTAANMYLGLKVGLTIATSIPAAVISMAFLGLFPGSNIRENNIVQTVCSAAGALASIIFILPSLVIIGWWTGFPVLDLVSLCAAGGVLGVLFTIPLRRALVTQSDLPYPEGVAAAEVLQSGRRHARRKSRSARGLAGGGLWRACVGGACHRGRHAVGRRWRARFFPHRRRGGDRLQLLFFAGAGGRGPSGRDFRRPRHAVRAF